MHYKKYEIKDLVIVPNPFFVKNARFFRKNLEILKIKLIFANVLPFINEYCDTEHIVKLAFAIYSKNILKLGRRRRYRQNKEQMFTIRGRLVCLTIRVRPSTQDVDELVRPHFVYT